MTYKRLVAELKTITKEMDVGREPSGVVKIVLYRRESNRKLDRYIKSNTDLALLSKTEYIPPVVSKYYAIYRLRALLKNEIDRINSLTNKKVK